MQRLINLFFPVIALTIINSAGCDKAPESAATVAVTNSLLECAARDLLGDATPILRLAEPGMCPGHFDIRPSQVQQLRNCRVLLRLDFQKSLDTQMAGAQESKLHIAEIHISGGLCEPESYLQACRQTADAMVAIGLLSQNDAKDRMVVITQEIEKSSEYFQQTVAPLQGTPVITSVHQEAFCRWLGLHPVAVFTGADSAGVDQIDHAVRQGEQSDVKLIIANLPEGRRVADALADRLHAKVVVFGNFPALNDGQNSLIDLIKANIDELMRACNP